MPPFVPRSRNGKGINDLDYGSSENVEYEGMLRPSAGSLGVGSLDLMALDCENGCCCEAIICGVCTEEKFFDDGDSDDCISVADVEMDQMHAEALQDWEDDKICLDAVGIRGFRTPTAKTPAQPTTTGQPTPTSDISGVQRNRANRRSDEARARITSCKVPAYKLELNGNLEICVSYERIDSGDHF